MKLRILLIIPVIGMLTGCPLKITSGHTNPAPIDPNNTNLQYPTLLSPPDIKDYVDSNLHVDRDGLTEYRYALAQYRAYLDRHEIRLTETYGLPERTVVEQQVKVVYRDVHVPAKVGVTTTPAVCPPAVSPEPPVCPTGIKSFRPLILPMRPIFTRGQDTDNDIIERLVEYILEISRAVNEHNDDHVDQ